MEIVVASKGFVDSGHAQRLGDRRVYFLRKVVGSDYGGGVEYFLIDSEIADEIVGLLVADH